MARFQRSNRVAALARRSAWACLLVPASYQSAIAQVQPDLPPSAAPAESAATPKTPTIEEERAEVAKTLEAAKASLEAATTEGQAAPESRVREVELLSSLDLTLAQVISAIEHAKELDASKAQLQIDLDNLRARGPTEPKPYAFALLETLRDQLASEARRTESLADAASMAQTGLASAKASLEEKERARRQAKEALETNTDDSRNGELGAALAIAQLESRLAAATVRLRELESAGQKVEAETHEIRKTYLREKIERVAAEVVFTRQGLDDFLARIDDQEYRVNQALDWAKSDVAARDQQWMEARRRLESSPTKPPELVEEVEARRLARQVRQREITLLAQQLAALAEARRAWNRRYETFNHIVESQTLSEWETETRRLYDQLARDARLHATHLGELRSELLAIDAKITSSQEASTESLLWIKEQKRQTESLIKLYSETVDRLEATRRLQDKMLSEISTEVRTVTWDEWFQRAWQIVKEVWNYEITSVQDNPITVRKVVIGLILLVIGTIVARTLTNMLAQRFFPRFGLNEGIAAAIQSLLFYLMVLTVAMLSLRVVNVPLTAFTILGGAMAIGIGFGSQNIVNNFISGLILLAERPIRVGDLIQIEDLVGNVEHIGPRSTRVRAPENMDIIVPNSSFLEKNVINWTLSDDRYRTHVIVGVAYGSPTREVTKLIRKAIDEHGKIMTKPEPVVLFADFGDNSLVFEAHFWVHMRRFMQRRIIESDVRYRIDSLFREAGVVIAFPQRDIHFDSLQPLRVQMLRDDPAGDDDQPGDAKA